jgi:hypothetical protein
MRYTHLAGIAILAVPLSLPADDKKAPQPVPSLSQLQHLGQIKAPTLDQARELAHAYVAKLEGGDGLWPRLLTYWQPGDTRTVLDRTIETLAATDVTINEYVAKLRQQPTTDLLNVPLLKDAKYPAYVQNNLKLFLARSLANQRLHEDGLAVLRSLTPETLVDPASYYFYRSVCENKLRLKEAGLLSTHRLLSSMQDTAPERYLVVSTLMQDEMLKWEDQDLGDIARRMEEIEARLDNSHGGPKTIEKQKEVITLLDKMIKDLEDQCQKCNQAGAGQAQSQQPAQESKVMQGAGQGDVDKKKLIITAEVWGKMPEKEKVKALEAVNRQLPVHIREAAEGFSKKLQTGGK